MYGRNVYYDPEKFGLEVVGDFEFSEPNYSFDMCVVWKEKRGRYWIGTDSGCSCPTPFEEVTDINELDGPYTKDGLRKRLDALVDERAGGWYGYTKAQLKKETSAILSRI